MVSPKVPRTTGSVSASQPLMASFVPGAYVNKRFALSKTGAAKLCFITAIFGLLSASFTYINCDDLHIAGVTGPYGNRYVACHVSSCPTN